jgi:hypothetical protein
MLYFHLKLKSKLERRIVFGLIINFIRLCISKKLEMRNDLWSVRITGGYRALAIKNSEDYYWIWIGSHDEYEALIE